MGARRAIALCQCFEGALQFQSGNWVEAEKSLRESVQLYHSLKAMSGEALAWQRLGVLLTASGKLDEGLSALQEGVVAAEQALMRAHCLTRLYATMAQNRLLTGDISAAEAVLALGLSMSERHGNCTTCDALLLPVAVAVYAAQGKYAEATTLTRRLHAAASSYQSPAWMAMANQGQATLYAAIGNEDEAATSYEKAAQEFESAGNRYEWACCIVAQHTLRPVSVSSDVFVQAQTFLTSIGAGPVFLPIGRK